MGTFLILGAGMMGSAISVPIADRGHRVRLVGTHLDEGIIDGLKQTGTHPKLSLPLPRSVEPFSIAEIERAAEGIDAVVFGVSSPGIEWACDTVAPYLRPELLLFMITKGLRIVDGQLVCFPDFVASRLAKELRGTLHPAAVAGPCIAGEIARRVPTCVALAGRDRASLTRISDSIATPYYRPIPTVDVVGAEICAALKNAYAMGMAFPAGMHERAGGAPGSIANHNLESLVMAQAVLEMCSLTARLGGRASTASGLAGVGDLDVTTNGGRTGRFGRLLGLGHTRDEAIQAMKGATLECLEILEVMRDAFARGAVGAPIGQYPLLEHLAQVALDGATVDVPIDRFFASELTES